jgi:hypothetical protein
MQFNGEENIKKVKKHSIDDRSIWRRKSADKRIHQALNEIKH